MHSALQTAPLTLTANCRSMASSVMSSKSLECRCACIDYKNVDVCYPMTLVCLARHHKAGRAKPQPGQ